MFGDGVRCVVVVGAQWGDEGKGKVVDALAERAALVVRYQGGANAGHTVDAPDGEFVLHQIPAGILHAGTRCVIGNGVVLDPETLFHEIDALTARGVGVESRLAVSDRAHLVLPYHKLLDAESPLSREIGTTGRGIGPAYEDKIGRRGVRAGDLRDRGLTETLVRSGVERANAVLQQWGSARRCDPESVTASLAQLAPRLLPFLTHDRVSLAGTMVAVGILYLALSLYGVRRGLQTLEGITRCAIAAAVTRHDIALLTSGIRLQFTARCGADRLDLVATVGIMQGEA